MLCDIAGLHEFTDFIDIDIISKLPAIRFSAQLSVQLLFRFQAVQQFLKRRNKRQTAVAGLCLCSVLLNDLALAVYCRLRNGVPNRNGLFLEVDGVPFQAYRLASAQTVKCTEDHAKLNGITTDNFKKMVQLILLIEAANELFLLGPFNPVCRIRVNQAEFESVLQGFTNIGVTVYDRIGRNTSHRQFVGVVVLYVLGCNILQFKTGVVFLKVRDDFAFDSYGIRAIGGFLHILFCHFQPVEQERSKKNRANGGFTRTAFDCSCFQLRFLGGTSLRKHLFGTLFVSLYRQTCRLGRRVPFAVFVHIVQYHVIVPVFLSQMSCYHNKASFDWYSADPSAIDSNIVADRSTLAKCANEVLRSRFFYQVQVFQNVELRDSIAATNNKALDLAGLQKPIGSFIADAAEHFTHLLNIDYIGIVSK